MYQLIIFLHVIVALCLIVLVLLQQGKGATIGAAFGSGASQTVFGSRGSGSFLLKVTIAFVAVFFLTSIVLNRMAVKNVAQEDTLLLPTPKENNKAIDQVVTPNSIPQLPEQNKSGNKQ